MVKFFLSSILRCFCRENQLPALRPPHMAQPLPALQWPWEVLTSLIHLVLAIAVFSVMECPSFSLESLSLEPIPKHGMVLNLVSVRATQRKSLTSSLQKICELIPYICSIHTDTYAEKLDLPPPLLTKISWCPPCKLLIKQRKQCVLVICVFSLWKNSVICST